MSTVEARLLKHRRITDAGCWEWTAYKNQKGYGRVRVSDRLCSAHRVAYETFVGSIPDGHEVDHLCSNRGCINPAHLEAVTHQQNVERGEAGKWIAAKTHCPSGHPYAGLNLYIGKRKERRCRECNRLRTAIYNATKRRGL